jgi:hypothetical protein
MNEDSPLGIMDGESRVNVRVHAWYCNSTPSSRGLVPPKQLQSPDGVFGGWAERSTMEMMIRNLTMMRVDAFDMRLRA